MDTALFRLEVDDAVTWLEGLPAGLADMVLLDPGVPGRSHKAGAKKTAPRVVGFPADRWAALLYEVARVLAPGRVCWWVCETSQAFTAARAAERMGFAIGAPMVWDRGEHQAVRLGFVLPLTRGRARSPGAEIVHAPRASEASWPGELPESLCASLVEAASAGGELVLDPFCGSGALGVAALVTGRRYFGCDHSAEAVAVARRRVVAAGAVEVEREAIVAARREDEVQAVVAAERAGPERVRQLTMFGDEARVP